MLSQGAGVKIIQKAAEELLAAFDVKEGERAVAYYQSPSGGELSQGRGEENQENLLGLAQKIADNLQVVILVTSKRSSYHSQQQAYDHAYQAWIKQTVPSGYQIHSWAMRDGESPMAG